MAPRMASEGRDAAEASVASMALSIVAPPRVDRAARTRLQRRAGLPRTMRPGCAGAQMFALDACVGDGDAPFEGIRASRSELRRAMRDDGGWKCATLWPCAVIATRAFMLAVAEGPPLAAGLHRASQRHVSSFRAPYRRRIPLSSPFTQPCARTETASLVSSGY